MSRKQWGNGFYRGVAAAQKEEKSLVGLWFHSKSKEDGEIEWQGCVDRLLSNGDYVVQLFEWFGGSPAEQKCVSLDSMRLWNFYPTAKDMRMAWYHICNESLENIQQTEESMKHIL